jgi:iron complex outermembrane receptor protein
LERRSGLYRIRLQAGYHYTKVLSIEEEKKVQMIYVPEHSASNTIFIRRGKASLFLTHFFQGIRFSNFDNTEWLPVFHILNIKLEYNIPISNFNASLFFYIYNITDVEYESIAFHPLPGTHFRGGINMTLNSSAK